MALQRQGLEEVVPVERGAEALRKMASMKVRLLAASIASCAAKARIVRHSFRDEKRQFDPERQKRHRHSVHLYKNKTSSYTYSNELYK